MICSLLGFSEQFISVAIHHSSDSWLKTHHTLAPPRDCLHTPGLRPDLLCRSVFVFCYFHYFLFVVPCGRLSLTTFLAHAKFFYHVVSYHIVSKKLSSCS